MMKRGSSKKQHSKPPCHEGKDGIPSYLELLRQKRQDQTTERNFQSVQARWIHLHKNKFCLFESEVSFSDTGTKPDAAAKKEYIDESVEPDMDPGERSHLIPATDTGTTSPPGATLHVLPPFSLRGDGCPTPTPHYDSVQHRSNATKVQNTRINVNVPDTTCPCQLMHLPSQSFIFRCWSTPCRTG